jgi:hypothetical protein
MTLNILLLCNKPEVGLNANTIIDHLNAIEENSTFNIWTYSSLGDFSKKLDLSRFDLIIIHYSLSIIFDRYISKKAQEQIRAFTGLKVIFIQDEYSHINKMVSQLNYLNIDVLFTCFPESEMGKIYSKSDLPSTSLYNNLTGYVPQRLIEETNLPLTQERVLHVGYRGRKLPFWYGELAYEKWNIVEKWKAIVTREDIKYDISYDEKDRIYGRDWLDFILSCKATLGVESGASVMDFTGALEQTIKLHELTNPRDDFYKVQHLFLKEHDGQYKLNQISPRCFEAIALKTVLVLYEGDYSGILIPGRHYIVLKKDYSNIDEVLTKLSDDEYLQNMAETAYREIALNPEYSYKGFISRVDEIINNEFITRGKIKTDNPYNQEQFDEAIKCESIKKKIYKFGLPLYNKLPSFLKLIIKAILTPKSVCYLVLVKLNHLFLNKILRKGFRSLK